jgi:hypothetical protein
MKKIIIDKIRERESNYSAKWTREDLIKEIKQRITEFAIEGQEPSEWKGAVLYAKIMKYLDELKSK